MPKYDFCYGTANECQAVHPAGDADIDDWDWRVTGGTVYPYGADYQYATIYPTNSSTFMVEIRAHNSCGWTDWARMWTNVITCRSYYLAITPNPSSGETTISIELGKPEESTLESASTEDIFDDTVEWELEVFDQLYLKEKITSLKGQTTQIYTSGWKEGIYMLRAKYKDEVITGKLVVQK